MWTEVRNPHKSQPTATGTTPGFFPVVFKSKKTTRGQGWSDSEELLLHSCPKDGAFPAPFPMQRISLGLCTLRGQWILTPLFLSYKTSKIKVPLWPNQQMLSGQMQIPRYLLLLLVCSSGLSLEFPCYIVSSLFFFCFWIQLLVVFRKVEGRRLEDSPNNLAQPLLKTFTNHTAAVFCQITLTNNSILKFIFSYHFEEWFHSLSMLMWHLL